MSILNYIEKMKEMYEGDRITDQEPRIGFKYGSSTFDAHTKREAAFKAYKDYKKSYYNSRQRNPIITFREFLPIYAKENFADGGEVGQLVAPSVDESRPGYGGKKKVKLKPGTYSGDFKTWYETANIKGQTPLEKYGPFDEMVGIKGKSRRGVIKSRDYPRWLERSAKLKDLRKTGHIPLEEFFAKHDVPDHYRTQMEFTSTSGRRKFNRSWFKKNLEKHVVNLEFSQAGGGGLFIKEPGKKLTEEFVKVFKTPDVTIRPNTVTNINKLWKVYGESHYAKGTFPPIEEVIKKMGGKFDMTPNAAATATRRISQIMNGTNFIGTNGKYISTNVIADKKAAKGILDKFQGTGFDTAYGSANYKINLEIVKEGLPEYTKGQSLGTWRDNARAILKDHGVKFYIKNKQAGFNLNELTGMGSGAQHGGYTSTQFVNLMEGKFNQTKHAALLKKYGEFEGKIKSSLSGPKPNVTEAKKLNKEWIDWRKNWLDGVDSKLKPQISKILPGFDFRANAAEKLFGKRRLNELMGYGLDVAGEARELRYLKTFGAPETMRKTPILKEVAMGEEKAIKTMKDMMHELNAGKSTLAYHTLKKGNINVDDVCFTKGKASGGRIGFKAGSVGQVCGIDFAQNKPNEFLRRVSKMKGADTFLRSAAGLKAAKGLLKSGKYFANPITLGGGEAWYSYLTFLNERSKGKSMGSSINEALWFIPGKTKRDMEMLVGYEDPRQRELFPDMSKTHGFEAMTDDQKKQFMALKFGKNIGEINKAASSLDSAQRTLRGENPNLPIAQISPHRDLTEQEQLARDKIEYNTRKFYKDLKEKEVEGEKLFTEYSDLIKKTEGTTDVSSEQFMKPIEDVKKRIQNQVVSEWNKALPTKYLQGDAWSGKKGSDIKSWFGKGPFGTPFGKTAKEEEMLKNMDARERYLYNVNARDLRHLRGPEDLTWKHYEAFGLPEYARELWFNKGGRAGYMGGGIAAIRKPHAIPPKRQGLRSIMINVNDD